ncbi:MAG: hypothetical protein ACRDL2_03315 [Gaiellaceae bacterium]
MQHLLRVAALVVVGGAVALAVGVGSGGATATGNSVTYQDSTGEDSSSLDISQVVVSNDDNGLLTFAITLANGPSALTGHADVSLYIDTDNNSTDASGADYAGAELSLEIADGSANAYKWDGSAFTWSGAQPTSLIYSYSGGVATIHVKASDLSLTSFDFWVLTDTDYSSDSSHLDSAPDAGHGTYAYAVQITPPPLPQPKPKAKPKKKIPKCKPHQKSMKAHRCHK